MQTEGAVCPSQLLAMLHGYGMLFQAEHLHYQCCSLIFLQALIRGLKSSSLAMSLMCQFHFFHLLVFVSLFSALTHLVKTACACPDTPRAASGPAMGLKMQSRSGCL